VRLQSGGFVNQDYRDRQISRLAGQVEYARSSSVALFTQVTVSKISYKQSLAPQQAKLDSTSLRLLGGMNVDIAGRWRGSVGVGYVIRNYNSGVYKTRRGVSAEVQVETFPSQRLTLSFNAKRTIEDISGGLPVPYFNTSASFRSDYELLRNMIITASVELLRQSKGGNSIRTIAGGRFLASRRFNLRGSISYSRRSSDSVDEARIEAIAAYQL
jgi:hypothetical protein